MFRDIHINMEQNNSINEAMQICAAHPQCIGCPLVDKSMNINGGTITCVNAQLFQKGNNK
jgi:hypothetical protein